MRKPGVSDQLWRDLARIVEADSGDEAKRRLAAGFPVYYAEDNTPPNLVIKEFPDGRRVLVDSHDNEVKAL